MYNGSQKNLDNLKKAREAGSSQQKKCETCGKMVALTGFGNHIKACVKGKACPVCSVWFRGKGTTCSRGCANSFFRSGENNPNWKASRYRSTCFVYHDFKCCICDEANLVEVHHFDENNKNNAPENLIPMCATHHQYMHSRFKHLIMDKVLLYIEKWKATKGEALIRSPLKRNIPKDFKFESKWKDHKNTQGDLERLNNAMQFSQGLDEI